MQSAFEKDVHYEFTLTKENIRNRYSLSFTTNNSDEEVWLLPSESHDQQRIKAEKLIDKTRKTHCFKIKTLKV